MTETINIDFSRLSLKDALDLAILIEDEAQERYEEFVDQLVIHHTREAAEFFRSMAANEAKHGAELRVRRRHLFQDDPSNVSRSMLWDVEAPDYDQTRTFMSVGQAMQVALACENKAHEFFARALEHITDPVVRDLFEELRDEEVVHQKLVRAQIARLPQEPGVNPDDYSDEPVAQ